MIESCPARAKSMIPMHIGMSSCRGELVLMTVYERGADSNVSRSIP